MKVTLKREVIHDMGLTGDEMYVLLAIYEGIRHEDELKEVVKKLKEKGLIIENGNHYVVPTNKGSDTVAKVFLNSNGRYEHVEAMAQFLHDTWPNGYKEVDGKKKSWKKSLTRTLRWLGMAECAMECEFDYDDVTRVASDYADLFLVDKSQMMPLEDFILSKDKDDKYSSPLLSCVKMGKIK